MALRIGSHEVLSEAVGLFLAGEGENCSLTEAKQLSHLDVLRSSEESTATALDLRMKESFLHTWLFSGPFPCTTTYSQGVADAGCFHLFFHSLIQHL